MKILAQNLKIPACSKALIADATKTFTGGIDPYFKTCSKDIESPKTEASGTAVLEMDKDGTFADIFGSISKDTDSMAMTQAQIIAFARKHKKWLRTDSYGTFFLFKVEGEFFVAIMRFLDDGQLRVLVDRFSYGGVWSAEVRHRIVVPQLTLSDSEHSSSGVLTLEARVKSLEADMEKIKKFLII